MFHTLAQCIVVLLLRRIDASPWITHTINLELLVSNCVSISSIGEPAVQSGGVCLRVVPNTRSQRLTGNWRSSQRRLGKSFSKSFTIHGVHPFSILVHPFMTFLQDLQDNRNKEWARILKQQDYLCFRFPSYKCLVLDRHRHSIYYEEFV